MAGPYLKWTDSQGAKQMYELNADEVLLGRKSDADIILPSASVSRHHAKLVKDKDGYSITDLSNTNGTYVNGQRVRQHRLHDGDRICLGQDRIELFYRTSSSNSDRVTLGEEPDGLERSFAKLASILPSGSSPHTDLAKISSILDFQYEFGKVFSAEGTFEQILKSALKFSGAERGCILLKRQEQFEYVIGMNAEGQKLPQSDFIASQTVLRQVARDGKPIYMVGGIADDFAEQQSIVTLNLRSVACMPVRWLRPESDMPEVQGVLYLDSTQSMRELSRLGEKVLNKLAVEAGNVFEKLEMIRTFEERKSLQLELALAQETQANLQNELRAASELRRAETQILLSENAASMGRFAAALSHELNSPLAVLKSALQTCDSLLEKKANTPAEKRQELENIEAQLWKTALESADRLHQIVMRMQRFTNMDRKEILPVDLNSLLQDVVEVLKSQIKDEVALELDLQSIPQVRARPQQMSAVFSNLLQNAFDGLAGGGTVWLKTWPAESRVQIMVRDNGRGISAEELAHIFDPAFKIKAGRVATGNWGLFSCRQIIREHGGEIEIQSVEGEGTSVRVTLPYLKIDE